MGGDDAPSTPGAIVLMVLMIGFIYYGTESLLLAFGFVGGLIILGGIIGLLEEIAQQGTHRTDSDQEPGSTSKHSNSLASSGTDDKDEGEDTKVVITEDGFETRPIEDEN